MPESEPSRPRAVVGVYHDFTAAKEAEHALKNAGVPASAITVGSASDRLLEKRAEMQQEMANTALAPPALLTEKHASRGLAYLVPSCSLAGAIIGFPFAFISFGSFSFGGRAIVTCAVGAAFGAVVGLILGASAGALSRASEQLATDTGITLRVTQWSPEIQQAMQTPGLRRLDEIDLTTDTPIVNLIAEQTQGRENEEIAHVPRGQWSAANVGRATPEEDSRDG